MTLDKSDKINIFFLFLYTLGVIVIAGFAIIGMLMTLRYNSDCEYQNKYTKETITQSYNELIYSYGQFKNYGLTAYMNITDLPIENIKCGLRGKE